VDYGPDATEMVDFDKVSLDLENPRHEPYGDEEEAIEYLCENEDVLALARDIVSYGLNPLELFGLLKDESGGYFVAEGNRRFCALMLLNDPELTPARFKKDFEKLAAKWTDIDQVFGVVFEDREEVKLWLDRIHAGYNEGRGRRGWNAEQKARNSGYSKNDLAQIILDLGQEKGFIDAEERVGRLSTVQRYIVNPIFRDALGLDATDLSNVRTTMPIDEFDIAFEKFLRDVAEKRITTRADREAIIKYANQLRTLDGVTGARGEKTSISQPEDTDDTEDDAKDKPKKPKAPSRLPYNQDLMDALEAIPSYKLSKVYYSLCSIGLKTHAPLLYVGAWTFLETLTAICGRNSATDFHSFLSGQRLEELGVGKKAEVKSEREAIKRVSELGNSTKHNKTSAAFNGEMLANDMQLLERTLIALARSAKGQVTSD
jgi:hypothetical protein